MHCPTGDMHKLIWWAVIAPHQVPILTNDRSRPCVDGSPLARVLGASAMRPLEFAGKITGEAVNGVPHGPDRAHRVAGAGQRVGPPAKEAHDAVPRDIRLCAAVR